MENRQKITEYVIGEVAAMLGEGAPLVTEKSRIMEDFNISSLMVLDLLAKLEEKYGMEFTDERMERIETVGDIAACIDEAAQEE